MEITDLDKHNLYDLINIADADPYFRKKLELNKLLGWFLDFFKKLERSVVVEVNEDLKEFREEYMKKARERAKKSGKSVMEEYKNLIREDDN